LVDLVGDEHLGSDPVDADGQPFDPRAAGPTPASRASA
jgi:hypothetical protein